MKKIVKRACAGMFAALMAVSARSVPSSATSVAGSVGGNDCGGSNNITSTGASARTYADSSMTLVVELHYFYDVYGIPQPIIEEKITSNANNPVTSIYTSANKPSGNTRSNHCYSTHRAVYSFAGNSYSWEATTAVQDF